MEIDFKLRILHEISSEENDNVDVVVVLNGEGVCYTATFATIGNIIELIDKYKASGECLSGKYFWSINLIIIERVNLKFIEEAVFDLLRCGQFFSAFGGPYKLLE